MPQSPKDRSVVPSLFQNSQLQWTPLNKSFTRVEAFRRMINHKHGLQLKDYYDLHKYSTENYMFWIDLWDFLGIISSVPPDPTKIVTPGTNLPFVPNWFPNVRMNYTENVLGRGDIDGIAITAAREFSYSSPDPKHNNIIHCSWRQLRAMVREMAAALKVLGVGVGDRVAAIVTNAIEGAVIALATASIGAIFSSTAPDMGTQGILDRYRQITPKIIFAETEVLYAGKTSQLVDRVAEVAQDLDNMKGGQLQKVVLLKSTLTGKKDPSALRKIPKSTWYEDFLATGDNRPLTFEQLPFNHPLVILYSSGTTGAPKCIVHSAGGILMQGMKDAVVQFGLGHDDTYFQFTTTGWMMWIFMLGTLAIGMRVIAYDGSPFHPTPQAFLKFVSDQRVTLWGVGPRLLTELWGRGIKPHDVAPFDSLRILMSTGAVLTPPMFHWAQESFGREVHVASSTGGTDVCSSLASGVPCLPVYSGEIQGKSLGIKLEVFDPSGKNIEHTGEAGEMVVTRPHLSLPLYFWGDDKKGTKYWKAYYETYNGVWRQGDFMAINPKTRGIVMVGRSDGVLNPSGIRFGSAEIYSVLEAFCSTPEEGVEDTLCIGQRRPNIDDDERVLLFVKMRQGSGKKLTKDLERRMKERIAKDLSRRHVPAYIFEVEDIPVTVNMKKIEIAVKQIVSGYNLKPSGTVANPEALKLYYKYRDIENLVGATNKQSRSARGSEKVKSKL